MSPSEAATRARISRRLTLVAVALVLAATATIPTAAPAQAAATCPVYNDGTYSFETLTAQKGVALCLQRKNGSPMAYWTIVDFKAGARARIVADVDSGSTPGLPATQFNRRQASSWFSWVNSNIGSPSGGILVSVTNASFFENTGLGDTALSFPLRQGNVVKSTGMNTNPGQRRWLGFGTNNIPYGYLGTYDYNGQNYTGNDPAIVGTLYTNVRDYVVGLGPTVGSTTDRRVYVGFRDLDGNGNGEQMIILQSVMNYTQAEASAALGWWGCPEGWRIQLDGGGSTQFYGWGGSYRLNSPILRPVPSVIAVWQAQ